MYILRFSLSRFIIILLILLGANVMVPAQKLGLNLNIQQPIAGDVNSWAVVLTTSASTKAAIAFQIQQKDKGTILYLTTKDLAIKGSAIWTWSDVLKMAEKLTIHPDFKKSLTGLESLPPGEYSICWGVTVKGLPVDEGCKDFIVMENPNLPLVLIAPAHGDTLSTPYPVFTWTPVLDGKLPAYYELNLYRMEKGQTPETAVLKNQPIHQIENIESPLYNYPVNAKALEEEQAYAWQVIALVRKTLITSNVEHFIYSKSGSDQPIELLKSTLYHPLSKELTGFCQLSSDQKDFSFLYVSDNTVPDISFMLFDPDGKLMKEGKLSAQYGYNFYSLDITQLNLKPDEFYQLRVTKENTLAGQLEFLVIK